MNAKKIAIIVLSSLLAGSITFGAIKSVQLGHYMEQLRIARERTAILSDEAARTRETNRRLNDVISEARETNTDLGASISRQSTTLSELRGQLKEVERNYKKMEELLYNCGDIYNNSNSSIISDRETE